MREYACALHGIRLRLATDSGTLASLVEDRLGHFFCRAGEAQDAIELFITSVASWRDVPEAAARPARADASAHGAPADDLLPTTRAYAIHRAHGRTVIAFRQGFLLCLDDHGYRADAYLVDAEAMHADLRANFLNAAVFELLKRRGVYTVHAASLAWGGQGVLIAGPSRRGKTTIFISLVRAGYQCMSDDFTMFRERPGGFELLAYPERVDVTDQTIGFFPELQDAEGCFRQGLGKRSFDARDVYGRRQLDTCAPALIIVPRIMDWPTSRLEPLPKSRALEELLPELLAVFDRDCADQQFRTLSRLVGQVGCYRLYFGEDVLAIPDLITPLLDARSAPPMR